MGALLAVAVVVGIFGAVLTVRYAYLTLRGVAETLNRMDAQASKMDEQLEAMDRQLVMAQETHKAALAAGDAAGRMAQIEGQSLCLNLLARPSKDRIVVRDAPGPSVHGRVVAVSAARKPSVRAGT
jgi:hypothetical protein